MTAGTKITLAVFTLFVGVLVVYYGVFMGGDSSPVVINDVAGQVEEGEQAGGEAESEEATPRDRGESGGKLAEWLGDSGEEDGGSQGADSDSKSPAAAGIDERVVQPVRPVPEGGLDPGAGGDSDGGGGSGPAEVVEESPGTARMAAPSGGPAAPGEGQRLDSGLTGANPGDQPSKIPMRPGLGIGGGGDDGSDETGGVEPAATEDERTAPPGITGTTEASGAGDVAPATTQPTEGNVRETTTRRPTPTVGPRTNPRTSPRISPQTDPRSNPRLDPSNRSQAGGTEYVVKEGDSLTTISDWWFGDPRKWDLIVDANPTLTDPNKLQVGQTLRLPAKDAERGAARPGSAGAAGASAPGAGERTHTVRSGDSLSSIAHIYYGDQKLWKTIHEANRAVIGEDANAIRVGMKLKIPPRPRPRTTGAE